jgi:drug/metabolite transporter (DMT)-like permease
LRPILLGICAAFFFAFTFILNRAMEISGGSWIWSASLRYFFMVPPLLFIVAWRRGLFTLFREMKKELHKWLLWSFIGFVLFYAPLCFASAYGPGWLIAGTWQMTIISGSLLAPIFYETRKSENGLIRVRGQIPYKGLAMSFIILIGIAVMQLEHATNLSIKQAILCVIPILIASFAYPLGNRKMMEVCNGQMDAYQRVLGMTIASLPFWFLLSIFGLLTSGLPSKEQVVQSGLVAVFSGVCATVLFFAATDLVKGNLKKLGAVEATQSMEVLFAVAGEVIFLSAPLPSAVSLSGMMLVMIGMVLHSWISARKESIKSEAVSV